MMHEARTFLLLQLNVRQEKLYVLKLCECVCACARLSVFVAQHHKMNGVVACLRPAVPVMFYG